MVLEGSSVDSDFNFSQYNPNDSLPRNSSAIMSSVDPGQRNLTSSDSRPLNIKPISERLEN